MTVYSIYAEYHMYCNDRNHEIIFETTCEHITLRMLWRFSVSALEIMNM